MAGPQVIWQPQPGPQSALLRCPVYEICYGGARGGGKGVRPTEKILTPFGWRELKDLKVGSIICAPDGTATKIIGYYERGVQPLYKITFSDGCDVVCDADHLWLAWRTNHSRKINNERTSGEDSAKKWRTEDIAKHYASGGKRLAIPVLSAPACTNVAGGLVGKSNFVGRPIHPYILGVLLGDGCITQTGTAAFFSADPSIAERILSLCSSTLSEYKPKIGLGISYRFRSGDVTEGLTALGLWGKRAETKSIPRQYLFAPVEDRWEILRGLMDTDGWVEEDGDCYFTSISKQLADDVTDLARSLGAVVTRREKIPTFSHKGEKKDGQLAYTARIKMIDASRMFYLLRKKALCENKVPQSMGRFIESIERCGEGETICIKVEHPDSLFIIKDYIVTHNTDAALGVWMAHSDKYGRHAKGVFFRHTLPQLDAVIGRSRELFIPLGATFKEQDKTWVMPGGGQLKFRHLENVGDAEAYQGHDYSFLCFEEAANWESPDALNRLKATLRSANGVPVKLLLTCNPGGPGHHWVKNRYIDPAPTGYKVIKDENGLERVYIPAKVQDNKKLLDSDPTYVARLKTTGSPELVKAWLEGDWNVIEGAYFPEFGIQHIVRPVELPSVWTRFRAFDWGSARPFCCLWIAVSDGQLPQFPKNALIVYRELYGMREGKPNVGLKLNIDEVCNMIIDHQPEGESITYSVADPSCGKQDGGPSILERMGDRKLFFDAGDNQRIPGWDQIRYRLVGEEGRPMLYVFSTCVHLIRTLPALQHDTNKPEEANSDGEDHACFAAGTVIDGFGLVENVGERTHCATDVLRLKFDSGKEIVCTPDHKFMTDDGTWIQAKDLLNRQMCSMQRLRNSEASGITYAASIFNARAADFIASCGLQIAALFQKARMSITRTMIGLITQSGTLNYSLHSSTYHYTAIQMQGYRQKPSNWLLSGMEAMQAGNGTDNTGKIVWPVILKTWSRKLARFAGRNFRQSASLRIAQSIVTKTARPERCVNVEPLADKMDVYCLATKDGVLGVSGLVASNCDALRYGAQSRPYLAPIPEKPRDMLAKPTLNELWDEMPVKGRRIA